MLLQTRCRWSQLAAPERAPHYGVAGSQQRRAGSGTAMAPRVKTAASKVGKSNKAKKPAGILKKAGAASKPPKAATRETKTKERRSSGNRKTAKKPQSSVAGDEQEGAPPSAKKQRKRSPAAPKGRARAKDGKTVPLSSNKIAKWKGLSRDSLEYVGAMVDGAVLRLLRKKGPEMEACQVHLLKLKERLIAHCQRTMAPPGVPGQYQNIQGKLELETEELESNQQTLEALQHEVAKSVKSVDLMTEEIECLKEKIFHLKSQLEIEEEENAGKVLFSTENSLSLELPKSSLAAPLLQDELLKIPNQEALLEDLHTARSLTATKDMQNLIEQAYAEADRL